MAAKQGTSRQASVQVPPGKARGPPRLPHEELQERTSVDGDAVKWCARPLNSFRVLGTHARNRFGTCRSKEPTRARTGRRRSAFQDGAENCAKERAPSGRSSRGLPLPSQLPPPPSGSLAIERTAMKSSMELMQDEEDGAVKLCVRSSFACVGSHCASSGCKHSND